MGLRSRLLIMVLLSLAMFVSKAYLQATTQLQYQRRANRFEGIRPKPVAGYDIELISVMVNYREETEQMPDHLRVRFYLDQSQKVNLIVRELDPKYYYWMDKVSPPEPWRTGFDNVFQWPTREVIQKLNGMDVYDLGVIARLGKPVPSRIERVAPAVLYHSQPPEKIKGYLFTFKTSGDARLSLKLYRDGQDEAFFRSTRKVRGGRAFTVRWESLDAPQGSYKLVVSGYLEDANDPIDQIVHFYHQPAVDP